MTTIATDAEILAGITAALATGDMVTFESVRKPTRMDGTTCENCFAPLRADDQLWPAADVRGRGCSVHGTGGRHFRAFPRTIA